MFKMPIKILTVFVSSKHI